MKRLILIFMILSLGLAGCGTAEISIEQPTAEPATAIPTTAVVEEVVPTEEPEIEPEDVYTSILDLTFDEADDLDWFDKGSPEPVSNEELIVDGSVRIGDGVILNNINFQPDLIPGSLVHLQVRVSSNVCFPIKLKMEVDSEDGEHLFLIDGCSMDDFSFKAAINNNGEMTEAGLAMSALTVIQPDVWTDVIYWLHPDGDKLVLLLVQEGQIAYGSVVIPEAFQSDVARLIIDAWFDKETQHLDINELHLGEGSLRAYLDKNVPAYQSMKDEVNAFLEADPQPFPEWGTNPGDEMQSENPFDIINTWFTDWEAVFGENVDCMKDNEGGQFGPGSMKVYNEEENVFTFSEMDGMIWTPLNTHLDEFDGVEPGGNQAIMIKFQPSVANALQFTFMGPNEFGVEFWDDGHPSTFYYAEAYKEGFEDDFALEAGLWYNMLMAIDKDGKFLAVVWEDGNYENHAMYKQDLSTRDMGEGYKNASWKFIIGSSGALTLNVAEYNVISFGGFNE